MRAVSEGGADQLSPCQALPKTINPTILCYANHQEMGGEEGGSEGGGFNKKEGQQVGKEGD